MAQLRKHLQPELLNRVDEVMIFDPLSHEKLRVVARLQMKDVAKPLAERGITLAVADAALDYVLAESYDPTSKSGALILSLCLSGELRSNKFMVQGLSGGG
ncbi:hypothetical protein SOVF_149640 isoform B [Spinacia oleracea]|nr:hypothetical protein SOVF_149640 isoform B [Spinacia oleracea]